MKPGVNKIMKSTYLGAVFTETIIYKSLNWASKSSNMELRFNPGLPLHKCLLGVGWILVIFHLLCDALLQKCITD